MRRCGVRVRPPRCIVLSNKNVDNRTLSVTRVAYSLIRYAGRARDIAREQTGRYGGEFLKQVSPLWN